MSRAVTAFPSVSRFSAPKSGPGVIPRSQALGALDAAAAASAVVIVTAPSGYGKTTAVAQWARERDGEFAWLTLGPLDGAPERLTRSILRSLSTLDASHRLGGAPDDPAGAYACICDAFNEPGWSLLVIDDAHRAGNTWTSGLLGLLVAQPPEGLRVVLVGQPGLESSSSRLALTAPQSIVRADALAFTESELRSLVSVHPSSVSPREILDETGGWPIAARLLILGGTWTNGSGDRALLRDFIQDHVLASLPDELSSFILDSTVCESLTPELAGAVTQNARARELLAECFRRGLFLDRYDSAKGASFRWHPVFARHCMSIRIAKDPDLSRELHRRASVHLESEDPLTAVRHALMAAMPGRARAILLERWLGLVIGMHVAEIEAMCVELSQHLGRDACVTLIRACATDVMGQHGVARELFAEGEILAGTSPSPETASVMSLGRLFIADSRSAAAAASANVRAMLAAGGGPRDRAAAHYLIGWSEIRHRTNTVLPAEYFAAAAREARSTGDRGLARRAAGHLAFSLMWSGALARASQTLAELDTDVDESDPWTYYAGGSENATSGYLAYMRCDPVRAIREFTHVIGSGSSAISFAGASRMMIAYAAAETGDAERCRRAAMGLQDIPSVEMHGVSWPAFRDSAIALLSEASGNTERALTIARSYATTPDLPMVCVALAGVLRRSGDVPGAFRMLRQIRPFAEVSYVKVATLTTAALLRRANGDREAAHALCESALEIAHAEDLRLPFGPRETQTRMLLRQHVSHGSDFEEFIATCLTTGEQSTGGVLTSREMAVYRQFQTSRTLAEIALELGLSVNTVKTHQRSIYRKLGVNSRREAVRAAL